MRYEATNWNAQRLHRVGGLATALTVLLLVAAAGHLGAIATLGSARDASEDQIAGALTDDEWSEKMLPYLGATGLSGLATLATFVITIIWLYRVAANHRSLGRQVTFGPGWAIGSWFLPPGLWLLPALVTREHWKAAEPSSPPGSETWRASPEPWLVWVWFALYGPLSLIVTITSGLGFGGGFGGDVDDAAENFVDAGASPYWQSAVAVASAIAWLLVVRGLTARHRRLTGEAA